VFSPYYARSRKLGAPADPCDHCTLNVALYGKGARRWTMTERGRHDLKQSAAELCIGPSALHADALKLSIGIVEKTALMQSNVIGLVTVEPQILAGFEAMLDEEAKHIWCPLAPKVHVEVRLENPSLSWSGVGYLDMNRGSEPLEDGFSTWNWSRANLKSGSTVIYDIRRRSGDALQLGLHIDGSGTANEANFPFAQKLPRTAMWRMPRETRSDRAATVRVARTLEDTPFYSRSVLSTELRGERTLAMHESLSLDRLRTSVVQTMLPYRMPREERKA
jgi:carotenoid 1,2-hydratase